MESAMSQNDSHTSSERSRSEETKALLDSMEARLRKTERHIQRAAIHFARARAIREGRPLPPLPEELPHQS